MSNYQPPGPPQEPVQPPVQPPYPPMGGPAGGMNGGYFGPPPLTGIGGWLVLFQICMYYYLFASVIASVGAILLIAVSYAKSDVYDQLTQTMQVPGETYQSLLMFTLVYTAIAAIYLIVILIWFYRRKHSLPKLVLGFCILDAIAILATYFMSPSQLNASIISTIIHLLVLAGWAAYFLRSRRVKNTFVR
ncbi:DUF2569 family protein [Paenibacillus bovis]|uniref:DUF2569 domain-containing protein n=1 Tax=Paenibacillus bovis TaxID=1616788 RepID=A0A172ZKE2_9BACL|nr:DUF2569 family protein [Paenibacillus bovis]ANF98115.1 hypothetical protein AR543_20295 [Paenibacillus bovis]